MSYDLHCDGCGRWLTFPDTEEEPTCKECRTARWLDDNEPNRSAWAGELDWQHDCHSDADPGL